MDIVSEDQYLLLTFIASCNRSHYNPTAHEVTLWLQSPRPSGAVYRTVRDDPSEAGSTMTAQTRMVHTLLAENWTPVRKSFVGNWSKLSLLGNSGRSGGTRRELVTAGESLLEHLLRLRWIIEVPAASTDDAGLRLTDLGRALLRDVETEADGGEDVSVVVLGREDPLAYPILVGQIAAVGPGLLVDPFLKLQDLHTIAVSSQLSRLLVSGKPKNKSHVAAMRAYLGSPDLSRRIEVRASTGLHDRVLMADDGDIITLGTSLNGVGKTTTVMTPMPSPAREALREEYERLWAAADLVGPPLPDDEAEAAPQG